VNPVPERLRIGMLGGAFDPPHWAHRSLAEVAVRQLQLDRLYIMPTGQAWHKARVLSSAAHRVAMCQAAFGDLAQATIDTREIQRAGPSYTADTLRELAAEYPGAQLFLVLGADQLLAFKTWSRWQEVLAQATLAVANRLLHLGANAAPDTAPDTAAECDLKGVDLPFVPLDMPLHDTSSTAIRAHVHGQSRRYPDLDVLVPEGVARYISEHHLYELPT
jgi:nicotinate-nucleotide adenylyltransferase